MHKLVLLFHHFRFNLNQQFIWNNLEMVCCIFFVKKLKVTVPYDQSTKWPPVCVEMSGGITIVVQRLEQQYKITVQRIVSFTLTTFDKHSKIS